MGPFDRFTTWLRGLLGREPAAGPEPTAEYRCVVCTTAVEDPDGECPLCHSTELLAADAAELDDVSGATERTVETDPEIESALRETLGEDPLEAHADRWERRDGGYRVEGPDGGVERPATRAELRATLRRLYD